MTVIVEYQSWEGEHLTKERHNGVTEIKRVNKSDFVIELWAATALVREWSQDDVIKMEVIP
jgi:hypothetical protein